MSLGPDGGYPRRYRLRVPRHNETAVPEKKFCAIVDIAWFFRRFRTVDIDKLEKGDAAYCNIAKLQ